jgi:hypothetical protein
VNSTSVAANLDWIRAAFCDQTYLFTTTGEPKMRKRGLVPADLEDAICRDSPEVVEDDPNDTPGPACLVLGWLDLAPPLHVVVGYGSSQDVEIEVITVYEPEPPDWYNPRVRTTR